ncbi:uncharacterized protein LOC134690906 [Mytilus trossulus]|uniref:uncharacterized protein LOC134690906 n=1 Tax=Mytilus trossulus TaxID=6551 RepID=UPI0030059C65
MICLLRNLGCLSTPSNGWDQLPHPNDTLPGANLATLKWYRNQLAHASDTSMDNVSFTDKCIRIEKALTSLNKGQRLYEVTEILNLNLDGEQENTLKELNQLQKEYVDCEKEKEEIKSELSYYKEGNLPKTIAETNAVLVETWQQDDESFNETKGSADVYNKVKSCTCVLVTSNSALGKTATIRHIAFKLRHEGFEIVPIESPEDIIKYKTNKKQVFLIDDVLGKYDLSPTLLERWERLNEKLISCLNTESGENKLLCTLRLQVSLLNRFTNASTILNKKVINLEHESIALSQKEKQKILMKHLSRSNLENEITTEEVDIICKTNYAFPLLCKLVAKDNRRFQNRIALFRQPLSIFKEELDKICNENKKLYCVLVLCMLFNRNFSRSIFDNNSKEYDEKIYKIVQTCRLQRNISKKELEDCALSAIGSYFTKVSNKFCFIHDVFEETISYHFYMFDPKEMFSECDIMFIRDRVRVRSTENSDENVNDNIVYILEDELNEDHFRPLYNRFKVELQNGRFSNVLMSPLFMNRKFVRIFAITFGESIHTLMKQCSSEKISSMDQSLVQQALKMLSHYVFDKRNDTIRQVMKGQLTLMDWTVALGCYELFRYAWDKMTIFERKMTVGRYSLQQRLGLESLFHLAVLGDSLPIVKELICQGADVNVSSLFWEAPLHMALKTGRHDMVRLLLQNRAQVSLREFLGHGEEEIPIAVTPNYQQFASFITAYIENDSGQTVIHEAVRLNDLENLRSNIKPEYIDSKTRTGLTVLHYAVLLDNLDAMHVLFREELPENEDFHCELTQDIQRECVCKQSIPNVNIGDSSGLTAVHLAVIKDNIEMLSLLLRNKADVNVRDNFYRTPLHYTKSANATHLLLTHSSQRNCFESIRNTYDNGEYGKTPITAFRTTCFNIAGQTAFRFYLHDFVNVQDKDGNTPLHSIIKRRLSIQDSNDCIETLIANGANPYLFNNSCMSALELIDCVDTNTHILSSTTHRQLIQNLHKLFALVTLLITISLIVFDNWMMNEENEHELHCVGEGTESTNITLVQVTRSMFVLLSVAVYWSFSLITFDMRYSFEQWLPFLILISYGSGFFILYGTFLYIETIEKFEFMFRMLLLTFAFRLLISVERLVQSVLMKRHSLRLDIFMVCALSIVLIGGAFNKDHHYFYDISTNRVIYTLNITSNNCTELSSVNISCTSLDYNISYRSGVDFSVQCLNDPNTTSSSYNGTLIVESEFINWMEIGILSIFWSHIICAYCFLHCLSIIVKIHETLQVQLQITIIDHIHQMMLWFYLFSYSLFR